MRAPAHHVMKWEGGPNPLPGSNAHKGDVFRRKLTSKALLDLESGDCRWPEGRGFFCGKATADDGSYCAKHSDIAHGRNQDA